MSAALRDARGCLTPAGFAALERAPVGRAPADLAEHLGTCSRCQDRMLARLAGTPAQERKPPPPRWRAWLVLVGGLVLVIVALAAASWLTSR